MKVLFFLFAARDKSERAFGVAFVKLMNADGTTLQDGKHNLVIYKVVWGKKTLGCAILVLAETSFPAMCVVSW